MPYEVEFTDELEWWWNLLTTEEQETVDFSVRLLEEYGPELKKPHADSIRGSRFANMRELRSQHRGRPYRILYIFDPRRKAMLLIGGDKTENNNWYREFVAKADAIYAEHLREIGNG